VRIFSAGHANRNRRQKISIPFKHGVAAIRYLTVKVSASRREGIGVRLPSLSRFERSKVRDTAQKKSGQVR
jgi:hypothetical protein